MENQRLKDGITKEREGHQQTLQAVEQKACDDLLSMLRAARSIFRDDSENRLRLVASLHDFGSIDQRIQRL